MDFIYFHTLSPDRALSLTWSLSIQIYYEKRKRLHQHSRCTVTSFERLLALADLGPERGSGKAGTPSTSNLPLVEAKHPPFPLT